MADRAFTVGCMAGPVVRNRLRSRDIEFECINKWPYEEFRFSSLMEFQLARAVIDNMKVRTFDG